MISTSIVFYFTLFSRGTVGTQIPLHTETIPSSMILDGTWDFNERPPISATGHLVFHSVASLLQHWPNTLYRNGHTLVPGTVPAGTLLYYGAPWNFVPEDPDWVATDPEHANMFCVGRKESGCWQLTLMAKYELKVLYFDGTSAGKMDGGTMDTQDVVAWGRVRPECVMGEFFRIRDLCEWGKKYELDGFVRMEMNFEIMLCNFTKSTEIVSHLNLPYDRPQRFEPDYAKVFRVTESGLWHAHNPGEHRVQLDLTRLVSFYDTDLFPSLVPARTGKERWEYRVQGISKEDVKRMYARLDEVLDLNQGRDSSSVDWRALVKVVMDRYGKRLEMLQYLLRGKEHSALDEERSLNWTAIAIEAYDYLDGMLNPYITHAVHLPLDNAHPSHFSWAQPVFENCATTHTSTMEKMFYSKFTPSEHLILESVKTSEKEICRILVRAWAQSAYLNTGSSQLGLDGPTGSKPEELVRKWEKEISELMNWLGWDIWVTCRPVCGYEEICYLPGWPFLLPNPSLPHSLPPLPPQSGHPRRPWVPPEAEGRPKPFCIRRLPPYEAPGSDAKLDTAEEVGSSGSDGRGDGPV
ncbi:hypothetical protein AN958_08433 [Leucoagaricus sp. SymC.cos]|nr:hypothetical protein AN958_08433 [Leucoagaricus sp. SymC.cos]